jgi:hypothetical protein
MELTKRGDIQALGEEIERLANLDEQCGNYAQMLGSFVDSLQLPSIRQLAHSIEHAP